MTLSFFIFYQIADKIGADIYRYDDYSVYGGVPTVALMDTEGKDIRVQLEIDFIATLGNKKYYVQSAYSIPDQDKYKQETASFDKTMDSFKKIIIVEKSMKPRYDEKRISNNGCERVPFR